jgi:hypothetical protein
VQWHRDQLIDRYCFYRPYREVRASFERHFEVEHHEIRYIRYRAGNRRLLQTLFGLPLSTRLWNSLFRRVAFMVVDLRKREK